MLSDLLDIIILLGAIQGFITSGLLWWGKPKRLPSRLLALIIFFIALACFNLYLTYQQWFTGNPVLQLASAVMPMVIVMPIGSPLYFYAQSLLQPEFKLTKKHKRHFCPLSSTWCLILQPSYLLFVYSPNWQEGTFQRTFRQFTGLSPSAYKAQVLQSR